MDRRSGSSLRALEVRLARGPAQARHHQGRRRGHRTLAGRRVVCAARAPDLGGDAGARRARSPTSSATPATRSRGRSPAAARASSGVLTSSLEDLQRAALRRDARAPARPPRPADDARRRPGRPRARGRARAPARRPARRRPGGLAAQPADPAWEEIGEALPIVTVGDALAGPDGGRGAVRQPRRRHAGAGAPSRPRPPPHRRADAEPPVDARPPRGARRRRGLPGARPRRHRGQRAPLDRGRGRGRLRPAALRPAPDRGLLPLGLDRLRRLRGGRRARARRPRRPLRRRLRRPPDRPRRHAGADHRGVGDGRRGDRGGGDARRGRRRQPRVRARVRVSPELVARASTAPPR